jgi:hypothetical protein
LHEADCTALGDSAGIETRFDDDYCPNQIGLNPCGFRLGLNNGVNGGEEPPDFGDLARFEMAVSLGRIRSPPSSSDFF